MKNCKSCHYYKAEKNKCKKLNKEIISELSCKHFLHINDTIKTWFIKPTLKKREKIVIIKHYYIK